MMGIQYKKLDPPRRFCSAVINVIKSGLHMSTATEALNNLGADAPQRLAKDANLIHLAEAGATRKEYGACYSAVRELLAADGGSEESSELYNVPVDLFQTVYECETYEDCVAAQCQMFRAELDKVGQASIRDMTWHISTFVIGHDISTYSEVTYRQQLTL